MAKGKKKDNKKQENKEQEEAAEKEEQEMKKRPEGGKAQGEKGPSAEEKGDLPTEIEELKNLNQDLNSRILRLRADFDNFRKRTAKERSQIARRANEGLLEDIIPVLDHFEMGLQTARDSDVNECVYEGFKLVYDQLMRALEKAGVERIDAEGEEFDPNLHECISHLPSEDVEEGVVSTQTRCGYKLGSYMLRAAQVVVSSGAPNKDESEED